MRNHRSALLAGNAAPARLMRVALWATKFMAMFGAVAISGCASFPPKPGVIGWAYEGPRRPQADVATVFITDGRPHYESGFICKVEGKPATPNGSCASVVHLLPGIHRIGVRYLSRFEQGDGEIRIQVEAGRLYQLNATSVRINNSGWISFMPMGLGRQLVYRNVAPNLFPAAQLDQQVPYGAE